MLLQQTLLKDLRRGCTKMNDIVNLIVNSSTSIVIIAYFIFRDYKWNEQLISTLSKIETILDNMSEEREVKKK